MVPFELVKQLDSAILMTQIYTTGTETKTTSVCSIRKRTSVIDDSCRPRINLFLSKPNIHFFWNLIK